MNSEWRRVLLGDLVTIPKKESEANPEEIELIRIKQKGKGAERSGKKPRATKGGRPYFKRHKGEILIARQSLHMGGAAIVSSECDGLICSNIITSLVPNKDVSTSFILHSLLSESTKSQVLLHAEGTAQSEISESKLLSVSLSIPPFRDQERISHILDVSQDHINVLRRQLQKTKELKCLVESILFSERCQTKQDYSDKQSHESEEMVLSKIATFSQGVQVGVEHHRSALEPHTVQFLRISDYTKEGEAPRYVDRSFCTKGEVDENDIVMIRYGEAGRVCRGKSGIIANNLFTITPIKEFSKDFLYRYLESNTVQSTFRKLSENTAMPAINFGHLDKIKVPSMSAIFQENACRILGAVDSYLASLDMQLCKQEILFESLVSDLITGKKRVHN